MTTNDERSGQTADTARDDHDATTQRLAAPGAPGPMPDPPRQRRLVRLDEGAPGAGVAAGLGAYFGVDPVLFRLGFVVLAFAGGVGLVLYLAGWIAMPKGTAADVAGPPPAPPDRATQWVAIGLAVIVGLLLLVQAPFAGPWPGWGGPFVWAVALIVLGMVLFRWDAGRRGGGEAAGGGPGTHAPPAAAPGAPAPRPSAGVAGGGATPPPSPPPAPPAYAPPPSPPKPAEPPSLLGRVATGAGLLLLGFAALLDNVGALDLAAYHYVALALTVAGVALLVGAWWGRARGFIAVGLLLLPLLVLTSMFGGLWGRDVQVGERFYRPQTAAEVEQYRLVAGELHVDLTELEFEDRVFVDAAVVAGDVLVLVPDDVNVVVVSRTGAGELEIFDVTNSGVNVRRGDAFDVDPDAPTLDIEARAGVGRVRVSHENERLLP